MSSSSLQQCQQRRMRTERPQSFPLSPFPLCTWLLQSAPHAWRETLAFFLPAQQCPGGGLRGLQLTLPPVLPLLLLPVVAVPLAVQQPLQRRPLLQTPPLQRAQVQSWGLQHVRCGE